MHVRSITFARDGRAVPPVSREPLLNPPLEGVGRRPGWRFLLAHPAHLVALGFGSGLSPVAPGTAGTLWAWLVFAALQPPLGDGARAAVLVAATLIGWWACTVTARDLAQADPSSVVWDEVVAFWLVLWLVTPATFTAQAIAFVLFRFFDAAKPGPVAWADQLFMRRRGEPIGWAQGFGILLDDFVAALCTLLVIAVWRFV
jgi:phosphatidylglycerophosphatase A